MKQILAPLPQRFDSLRVGELLCNALAYIGFSIERQARVKFTDLNLKRYRAFFGEDPIVHLALIDDLEDLFPGKIDIKNLLMTLNWFKGYDNLHVLAGRWDKDEKSISKTVKKFGQMIQSLKSDKLLFEFGDTTHRTFLASLDTVNFKTSEFRLDPSSKWYDQKSHSSGLVSKMDSSL